MDPSDNTDDTFSGHRNMLANSPSQATPVDETHSINKSEGVDDLNDDVPILSDGTVELENPVATSVPPAERMTRLRRITRLPNCITTEVIIYLYFFVFSGLVPLNQDVVYERVSSELNLTAMKRTDYWECEHMNKSDPRYILKEKADSISAKYMAGIMVCIALPSLISTALMGPYSDKTGRKKAMITPLIGTSINIMCQIITYYTKLPIYCMFFGALLDGMMGGVGTLVMASFAYVADVTTREQRVFRMVIVDICLAAGTTTAQLAVGFFLKYIGIIYSYVVFLVALKLAGFYATCFIAESRDRQPDAKYFTTKHIKSVLMMLVKDDGTKRLWKLYMVILILTFLCSVEYSNSSIIILYAYNSPLCWNMIKIGYFLALASVIRNLGGLGSANLLRNKVSDITLMIMGSISGCIYYALLSQATIEQIVYVAPFTGMMSLLVIPVSRATASKLAQPHEQGSVFSIVSWTMSLSTTIGNSFFNLVYANTLEVFHGFVFLIMALFYLIDVFLAGWLFMGLRKEQKSIPSEQSEDQERLINDEPLIDA